MTRPSEEDWRLESMRELGQEFAQLEQEDLDIEEQRAAEMRRAARRRRWRLVLGGAALVVVVAIGVTLVVQQSPKALAAPNQAAAAAERAGMFAFQTRSELRVLGRPGQLSRVEGEVDLVRPGGFRVRIQSGADGSGFERIVFPTAVYVRHLPSRGARHWLGVHLSPPATITPRAGGAGDPLGLLAVLAKTRHAQRLGVARVRGKLTQHYRVQFTLGAFLAAEGQAAQPTVASLPVTVDVWQNSENQLLRAVRTFQLPARSDEKLVVRTEFGRYGQPTAIRAPAGVPLVGSERLDPLADDPLLTSVLSAITFGTEHSAIAVPSPARQPRIPRGATSRQAGGPTATP
jgi:hypothetical protein